MGAVCIFCAGRGRVERYVRRLRPRDLRALRRDGPTMSSDLQPHGEKSAVGNAPLKPPFAYFGGKTRIASRIADVLPTHRHYVEPFAGSLAVLLAKPPSKLETVNDLDGDLMLFWRVLRDRPEELIRAAALTPHSRAEHQLCMDIDGADTEMERARRVWGMLTQGRAGTMRKTGWRFFAKPAGTSNSMPAYLDAYVERMTLVAARLRAVSLECRPALEVIETYGKHDEVLLYLDSPYEGVTRPKTYDGYRHEMRATADHAEMLTAASRCRGAVVISGYRSDLYDEALDGWDSVDMAAHTGQGDAGTGARVETLWSNRPLGLGQLEGIDWNCGQRFKRVPRSGRTVRS